MGKLEIRPLAMPKPLNRLSQKVAHVITSRIFTDMQNLVAISQGVSFPRMRETEHQNVYSASFFGGGSSNSLQPRRLNRFSRVIRQTTRFRARMCIFGVRRQKKLTFTPVIPKKTPFLGPILTGLRKLTKNRFTMRVLPCKLPLIVVVAPKII